ncbi:alpha/beta fold hydrolase [Nitratireductor pacificus]|uniref:Putative dioxygenase n=1 Tax=Nitratireductor pacificus pht-3B TaxID=391937 RepID=K2LKD0_9HYPH|nr:alpha/beta hydrolase [Nitratireductor pacificus]EKF18174.1 putative dioxygenase [Nitratireductor pacificus pht-3B]
MKTIRIGANPFTYDEAGSGDAVLLLSGWCQDHRLFKHLAPELARTHRVIRLDWRGHGEDRSHDGDFTTADQASDIVAFVDALGLEKVVPVSTSHGGWANIEATDRLGVGRVPRSVVIDWIMVTPNESFFTMIDELQDRTNWENGRSDFFGYWIGDTDNRDIVDHVNNEMAGFDYEMWARSGREIARAYRKWGNPMARMKAIAETRPVTHIFSQPFEQEYLAAQQEFAVSNPWFQPTKLKGTTHFPTLEQPRAVADTIRAFLK